jgi:hypothetical protein
MAKLAKPPESHLLDQAGMLEPKQVEKAGPVLLEASQKDSVRVYLVTVAFCPNKKLPPQARAEELSNKLTQDWIGSALGAVVLFDKQTGLASIATSKTTDDRFSQEEINMRVSRFLQTGLDGSRKRPECENIVETAIATTLALQSLQREWVGKRHRVLLLIGLIGLTIVAISAFRVTRAYQDPAAKPENGDAGDQKQT